MENFKTKDAIKYINTTLLDMFTKGSNKEYFYAHQETNYGLDREEVKAAVENRTLGELFAKKTPSQIETLLRIMNKKY